MSRCAGEATLCCTVTRAPRKWSSPRRYAHSETEPARDSAPVLDPSPDPDPDPNPETSSPDVQDAELFNCFRNEPIARLWLSGSESLSRRGSDNNDYYDDDDEDEDEDEDEEWGAKRVGRKSKGSTRWPVGPSRGAAIQKRVPPTVTAAATWEIAELVGMVVDEVALVATHPCVHAAPRVAPTSTRAAAPVTSPVGAAETKSVPVPVHYEVQHAAPRVDDVSVEDPSLLPSEPHTVSAKSDELLDQLLLPRGMMYSVYAV